MKEAHDHKRVTPEGRAAGEQLVRLIEPCIAKLNVQFMVNGSYGVANELFEAIRVLKGTKLPRKD